MLEFIRLRPKYWNHIFKNHIFKNRKGFKTKIHNPVPAWWGRGPGKLAFQAFITLPSSPWEVRGLGGVPALNIIARNIKLFLLSEIGEGH